MWPNFCTYPVIVQVVINKTIFVALVQVHVFSWLKLMFDRRFELWKQSPASKCIPSSDSANTRCFVHQTAL